MRSMRAERHPNEIERVEALRRYRILDTPREAEFDDLVALAARICETPIALVTLLDSERQWFKAALGVDVTEVPYEDSLCSHTILQPALLEVPDLSQDRRFNDNSLINASNLRFYAAMPLRTPEGLPLGTLCVLDTKPRELTDLQRETLRVLARQVMTNLELRRELMQTAEECASVDDTLARAEVATWRVDLANGLLDGSPLMRRFFGIEGPTSQEAIRSLIHSEDRATVTRAFAEFHRTGRYEAEFRVTGSDGRERWIFTRGELMRDEEGESVSLDGVAVDITERRLTAQALADERARVDATLELAGVATWAWNASENRVQSNPVLRRFFGIPDEQEFNLPLLDFLLSIHPEDRGRVSTAIGESVATGESYEAEYRVIDDGGKERWVLARGQLMPGTETLSGVLVDVTQRKAAEAALDAERKQFRSLLDEVPAHVVTLMGADLRYEFANRAFLQFLGRPADFLGQRADEAWPVPPEHIAMLQSIYASGETAYGSEVPVPYPSDPSRVAYFDFIFQPLRDAEDNVNGIFVHSLDVTDKLLARRQVAESEERFRIVARATRDAVWDWNLRDDSVWWNEGISDMLGYTGLHPEPGWWLDRVHPDDRERVSETIRAAIAEGKDRWSDEYRFLKADGSSIVVEDRGFIIFEEEKPVRMVGAMVDVTERRMAQRRLETMVADRTAELREAVKEAEAFNYSISHDLRTPLRAISSTSQILLEDAGENLGAYHQELLQRQVHNARRLGLLIDQLLLLSRLGRVEMVRSELDLTELARSVVDEVDQAQGTGDCDVDVQEGMCAEGDAALIRLVLMNLIENACKFSRGQGPVKVRQEGGVFSVSDQGIGFDMKYASKLFLPFERLVRESDFPGTGIGLANVERIVRRHGGQVWAESEPGKGTTFYFTLGADAPQKGESRASVSER
jgi:PAS domain S-box-containing protein